MTDIEQMYTDLTSHHIEGVAHVAPHLGYFKVPLISEVIPGLWQGGCIHGVELPHDFDVVISLYPWEKYTLGPDTIRHEFKAYDSADVPDVDVAVNAAVDAYTEGKKVLIHCQAGLNRSGLVAGLALMCLGYHAADAITQLRISRCEHVLCNKAFEDHLYEVESSN